MKKKQIITFLIAVIVIAAIFFVGYQIGKPKEYPPITDKTELNVKMNTGDWGMIFSVIDRNITKIVDTSYVMVTNKKPSARDSIMMAFNTIRKNLLDQNPRLQQYGTKTQ